MHIDHYKSYHHTRRYITTRFRVIRLYTFASCSSFQISSHLTFISLGSHLKALGRQTPKLSLLNQNQDWRFYYLLQQCPGQRHSVPHAQPSLQASHPAHPALFPLQQVQSGPHLQLSPHVHLSAQMGQVMASLGNTKGSTAKGSRLCEAPEYECDWLSVTE